MKASTSKSGINFSKTDIDWPSGMPLQEYLDYGQTFLELDDAEYARLLNPVPREKIKGLLYSFSFYQYVAKHTSAADRMLKSVSLIFLVEGLAPKTGSKSKSFQDFLINNLNSAEKLQLIYAFKFYSNSDYRLVCYQEGCISNHCTNDCTILAENIDAFAEKVLKNIYKMRCSIVHAAVVTHISGNIFDAYCLERFDDRKFENYYCTIEFDEFKSIFVKAVRSYLRSLSNFN